jgi:hypothetical protein
MLKYSIGDIVRFNEGGKQGVGILYEVGNKTLYNYRVQDIKGNKHKYLTVDSISDASQDEVKGFINDSGVALSKVTIIEREAGEVGMSPDDFINSLEKQIADLSEPDEETDDDDDDE